MWCIDTLVEQRIAEAQGRGDFDDLPGRGAPLALDDLSLVPEELRAGYLLLKNAGCLPPELAERAEIAQLEQLIREAADGNSVESARRRLALLRSRRGDDFNLLPAYAEQVGRKLG